MAEVIAACGRVVILDDDDAERLPGRVSIGSHGYAQVYDGKVMTLHRWIMGPAPEGRQVDHRNRDRLDNRRANLRWRTPGQNSRNKPESDCVYPMRGRWQGKFRWDGIRHHVGTFDSRGEAIEAVRAAKASLRFRI